MYKIAIDIGGTDIKHALFDSDLNFINFDKVKTPDNKNTYITDIIYQIVKNYKDSYKLFSLSVGISSAGVIDEQNGIVMYAGPTIPNFKNTNFKEALSSLTSNIHVYNDVNAALLGELLFHKYQENYIFCLTLGTGIGGAFYNHNEGIYNGASHRANEIGYLLYDLDNHTTFEERASTSALKKMMESNQFQYKEDVPKLFDLARSGDSLANNILEHWSENVAEGLAQIQIIYDPSLILIGGGISSQGEILLNYIVPKIKWFLPYKYKQAKVHTTRSGNHASLYGAISKFV